MNSGRRLVAVDVETTGISTARGGRVIEVAAIAIEDGSLAASFQSLIDTKTPISTGAYRVHGISQGMLYGKPDPRDVWSRFRDFVSDSPLIAHNAPFDSSYILHELALLGHRLPNRWYCTVRLARKRLPHLCNHKLGTVARHLFPDLPADLQLHRAMDDARLAGRIWLALEGAML